jgi:hypothetical protein
MTTDAPYSRVYATLARDHPRVWFDPPILGWYVRLLLPADRAWPGLADLPRSVPDDVLDVLVADEVIDLVGESSYRFHGLDNERNGRRSRGYQGGKVRATSAPRDAGGRFAAGAGYSSVDAGSTLDDDAGSNAGNERWTPSEPANLTEPKDTDDDLQSSSSVSVPGESPARGRARGEPGVPLVLQARDHPNQGSIECSDYQGHAQDHRWIEGVGWRCLACERVRAQDDLTFSEKVARAGQDAW